MAAAAASASLCFPTNGNRPHFRAGFGPNHFKRPRRFMVRSDLDSNVSDMRTNGENSWNFTSDYVNNDWDEEGRSRWFSLILFDCVSDFLLTRWCLSYCCQTWRLKSILFVLLKFSNGFSSCFSSHLLTKNRPFIYLFFIFLLCLFLVIDMVFLVINMDSSPCSSKRFISTRTWAL